MSATLLETPLHAIPGVVDGSARYATDPLDLWRAVDRVAGAAFCADLDPLVVGFARARIADHFDVADDLIDAMIATQLLSLANRLRWELGHIAAL